MLRPLGQLKALQPDKNSIPQSHLDIEHKEKTNPLPWRGQFNPHLVELLIAKYANDAETILDPFCGSGTVLLEASRKGKKVYGSDINPAAFLMSSVYEFCDLPIEMRHKVIRGDTEEDLEYYSGILKDNQALASNRSKSSINALHSLILGLPHRKGQVRVFSADARHLLLENNEIDVVITSPPYINVFNYHQNQREIIEKIGFNVLSIAKSEIGSNRANRGNRLLTVIQYCIDMTRAILESSRVTKETGKIILVVGRESNVLGFKFYNSQIIHDISTRIIGLKLIKFHERKFTNKFGEVIYEDILVYENSSNVKGDLDLEFYAREVASYYLEVAESENPNNSSLKLINEAIKKAPLVSGTPIFNKHQSKERIMTTPHYAKLAALLRNTRLPASDRPRVEEALERYNTWIEAMNSLKSKGDDKVRDLANLLNQYKIYIDFDLIYSSENDFLYRQKGQLKLDNSILEEFLPRLVDPDIVPGLVKFENLTTGPQKSYAGMSFTFASLGIAEGGVEFKFKDQDFTAGRKYYIKMSGSADFSSEQTLSSEINVAYFAGEIKTNLDKTMFQEASATAKELKQTVTGAKYILICEWLDMTPISTKITEIDQVILLRRGKRLSSNLRENFSTVEGRKAYSEVYKSNLDNHPISADSLIMIAEHLREVFPENVELDEAGVLARGYF